MKKIHIMATLFVIVLFVFLSLFLMPSKIKAVSYACLVAMSKGYDVFDKNITISENNKEYEINFSGKKLILGGTLVIVIEKKTYKIYKFQGGK